MSWNTVILLKGKANLTSREMKKFKKGDTIFGVDSEPQEISRWCIEDEADARKALTEKRCSYEKGIQDTYITEYALEYCDCDENGEFIEGSDYDLAEEI